MAFLSVVVNLVDGSGSRWENRLSHARRARPITPTTSAHYRETQKVLRVRSSRARETSSSTMSQLLRACLLLASQVADRVPPQVKTLRRNKGKAILLIGCTDSSNIL